jgi:NCS2 family nucleobase:cation symporter-2
VRPELLSKLPAFVHEVFGSGISTSAIVAVALNLVLPDRPQVVHEDEVEEDLLQPMLVRDLDKA